MTLYISLSRLVHPQAGVINIQAKLTPDGRLQDRQKIEISERLSDPYLKFIGADIDGVKVEFDDLRNMIEGE